MRNYHMESIAYEAVRGTDAAFANDKSVRTPS
jgi:hypothetical protein